MSFEADLLIDRKRLRRKLTWWRAAAFLVLILAVGVVAWAFRDKVSGGQAQIARISLSGFISGDERTLNLIRDVGESQAVRAVIVQISSPGGTTSGAERVYNALRELSAKKPTVAVVGGLAASGGYIAAIGTDRIVALETSLVGSIGVLMQYPNVEGLLDTLGVKMEEVKSSPLKAAPNGFEPTSPAARAALESLIADSYAWFKRLVRERRRFDDTQLTVVADGRVFTGHQAAELGLIDQIGDRRDAIRWLEQEKKVTRDLPVREWKRSGSDGTFGLWSALAIGAHGMGLTNIATIFDRLDNQLAADRLDGLLALWHPALEK
ncbi:MULTISPECIES: signal peptide peptidase SppA [unclassified Chelatococcus]|uniref:signal peptide peptidase SppA n=1 Tax=unclassified Chelatococcus TaxID=2638111 RepID=UPI001BCBE2C6|nr:MULTISPECIES: signal peptide peptidase SppA [unclassified Chelatococcus]MBS7696980.1 signal peptide peptidase SppA [Chelatococcus sp. YT9]MBX3555970.1 signal peptide peptidase SppA [Chelatococcus sp.]